MKEGDVLTIQVIERDETQTRYLMTGLTYFPHPNVAEWPLLRVRGIFDPEDEEGESE